MYRSIAPVVALAVIAAVADSAADARAQYVTYYQPALSYYAPAPVAYSMASPVVMPAAAPATYTVASPVVVEPAAPVITSAPVFAPAPAVPVVTYYRAPVVGYTAVPQVMSRYRPFLGGTVSRVRYSYMPVVY